MVDASQSSASSSSRHLPNIVVTGTPGTGKTSHAQAFLETCPYKFQHLVIGDIVKERGCHEGWNEEWQSYDVDDDKLLDVLEDEIEAGGKLLDWHSCETFPERWIDLVVVLRCDHTKLWERLEKRGYALKKIQENNEAEIMQTVLEEARASYADELVVELQSDTPEEMDNNVDRMVQWVENWRQQKGLTDQDTERK